MMEAFVRPQNRGRFLEKRFDYLDLVPAAAAICYPFLLNAFHAIVGTQAVSPPPLAIASATFILVFAFVVPFLGIALACRPTSPRLCQRGVANALCLCRRRPDLDQEPHSRRGRLVRDLARDRDLVAVCPRSGHCSCACSRGLAGCPRGNGRGPVPICGVSSRQSSVRLDRAGCACSRYEDRTRGLSLCRR